jgi:Chaperone of endosialidase
MSNSNPTEPAARGARQWDNPEDQRKAGLDFLRAILTDDASGTPPGALRKKVVSDRKAACSEFASKGNIPIPNDVELICVEPDIPNRKKLVVLILPEKGDQLPSDLSVLQHWPAGWTPYSSARFKRDIETMGDASSALLSLRPVTFRYNRELDPNDMPQFGLVAEEVEKLNPDLVGRDAEGKALTVRYEAVNAMLLNEFLKQHRAIQELKSAVAKQEATIARSLQEA